MMSCFPRFISDVRWTLLCCMSYAPDCLLTWICYNGGICIQIHPTTILRPPNVSISPVFFFSTYFGGRERGSVIVRLVNHHVSSGMWSWGLVAACAADHVAWWWKCKWVSYYYHGHKYTIDTDVVNNVHWPIGLGGQWFEVRLLARSKLGLCFNRHMTVPRTTDNSNDVFSYLMKGATKKM